MPQTIIDLIECFKKFSGIGEKTAERMALQTLELDQDIIDLFVQSLLSSKTNIKTCKVCHNLTEQDICSICSNENRTNDVICVVEEPKNVFQFEKMGIFPGKYQLCTYMWITFSTYKKMWSFLYTYVDKNVDN